MAVTKVAAQAAGSAASRPPIVAAAAVVIVLAGLYLARDFVVLIVFSFMAALLVVPLHDALRRRGLANVWATLIGLAAYVLVLAVAGFLLVAGLASFLRDLPTYEDELHTTVDNIMKALGGSVERPLVEPATVTSAVRGFADWAMGALVTIGYSVPIVAYLLLELPRADDRLRWAFGDKSAAMDRTRELANRLRTFVVARAVLGAIAAVLDVIALFILGVPAALLWGLLSFLLSFIPNVGFILSLIPPTILAFLTGGPGVALAVIVAYSVINVTIDYVVQPRFIGGSVDISPVVVTVSIVFWGGVLGGAGALLAVPLTLVAVALADAFDGSRPYARMLRERVPTSADDGGAPTEAAVTS
jgi:predicted PurR-regulated permease PerM